MSASSSLLSCFFCIISPNHPLSCSHFFSRDLLPSTMRPPPKHPPPSTTNHPRAPPFPVTPPPSTVLHPLKHTEAPLPATSLTSGPLIPATPFKTGHPLKVFEASTEHHHLQI
ncbi:hypothetical protein M8C21_001050 [Ambrosia artemisiifolia]|uniref:Uncharacterized protein n=1 Tax=Ambrosia artemisiifolia TaxID=4212 RepID=A0AAD5G4X6_AMBAR|nr:hypothetical protein M8C21_001050 [Ambrosia artemisiifolia]